VSFQVSRFGLGGLRVFAEADFVPGPGISWFLGANGAGKTTIVESAYVLGHGRSFRAAQLDALLRPGAESFWVSARTRAPGQGESSLGAQRLASGAWSLRADGRELHRLSDVARRFPVLCFEPGSHVWVGGPSERRRRLLDWGAFHVERSDPELWVNYQRALRQRNAALRSGDLASAEAWEPILSETGEAIASHRSRFFERWAVRAMALLRTWSAALSGLEISLRRGWGERHGSLLDALASQRARDAALGYTYSGAHRADLALRLRGVEARELLSRGQTKTVVLALLLAQMECYRQRFGTAPLLLLDDLCSELDATHTAAVLSCVRDWGCQVWVTGVERPDWAAATNDAVFHVEQGAVTPLI